MPAHTARQDSQLQYRILLGSFLLQFFLSQVALASETQISAKCELGKDGKTGSCTFQNEGEPLKWYEKFFFSDESQCFNVVVYRSKKGSSEEKWLNGADPEKKKVCSGIIKRSDVRQIDFVVTDRVVNELCRHLEIEKQTAAVNQLARSLSGGLTLFTPSERAAIISDSGLRSPWSNWCEVKTEKLP
jgi:hypothetical protein